MRVYGRQPGQNNEPSRWLALLLMRDVHGVPASIPSAKPTAHPQPQALGRRQQRLQLRDLHNAGFPSVLNPCLFSKASTGCHQASQPGARVAGPVSSARRALHMLEQPPCCHTPCSHQTAKQRRRSPLLTTPAATTAHLDDVGKGHAIARQHQHLGGPRLKVAARLHQPAGWWGASGPHKSRCRVVHVCRQLSTAV